jgi:hypothetical protein
MVLSPQIRCRGSIAAVLLLASLLVFSMPACAQTLAVDAIATPTSVPTGGSTSINFCVTSSNPPVASVIFTDVIAVCGSVGYSVRSPVTVTVGGCTTLTYPGSFTFSAFDDPYAPTSCYLYSTFDGHTYTDGFWQTIGIATTTTLTTPPSVTLTASNTNPAVNEPIILTVSAAETTGGPNTINFVDIYCTGAFVGSWTPMIASFTGAGSYTFVSPGTYSCVARAIDANGAVGSAAVTIVVGGCDIAFTPIAPITYGQDFNVQVSISGCPIVGGSVELTITDPLGATHKANPLVGGGTVLVSYLTGFDNSPNTDVCGYYGLKARYIDMTREWPEAVKVVPPLSSCDTVSSGGGGFVAERTTSCANLQGISGNEALACCDLDCCNDVTFNSDCGPTGPTRTAIAPEDITVKGLLTLCTRPSTTGSGKYDAWDVDSNEYVRINTYINKVAKTTTYTLIDKDECIVADQDTCTSTVKALIIDRAKYIELIHGIITNIHNPDMIRCRGFYWTWLYPGGPAGTPKWWPYEYELSKSRYTSDPSDQYNLGDGVYPREYVDYFYCYLYPLVPAPISKSRWCHDINLGWYSVLTPYQGTGMSITRQQINDVQRWNNLTGYIVAGHVCPWCLNQPDAYELAMTGP